MNCRYCEGVEHSGGCDREALKRRIAILIREARAADAYIYNFGLEVLHQPESAAEAMVISFRRFREVWIASDEVPVAEGKPS